MRVVRLAGSSFQKNDMPLIRVVRVAILDWIKVPNLVQGRPMWEGNIK